MRTDHPATEGEVADRKRRGDDVHRDVHDVRRVGHG
jgi:hypothetical protein